jgi:signal transduction histidine kinase
VVISRLSGTALGRPVCQHVVVALGVLARLAVVCVAVAAGLESLRIASRTAAIAAVTLTGVATLVAGWTAVLCGLLVVSRRRTTGVLLVLSGLAWFAADWNQPAADGSVLFTIGLLIANAYPVLLVHTCLRSATSQLGTAERVALAIGYASTLVLAGLLPALVFDPVDQFCYECPSNLVDATSDAVLFDSLTRAGVLAGIGWSLVIAAAVVARLVRSRRALRDPAAVMSVPTLIVLGAVFVDFVHSAHRGFVNDDPVDRRLLVVQAIALTAAALGSLWPEVQRLMVRRKVTNLVVEVAGAPRAGRLAETLGAAVGDPTLRVLYPLSDGRVADASGSEACPAPGQVTTPLVRGDRVVALLAHRPGQLDAGATPGEIARAASLVLDNERLQAEARSRLAELRESSARIAALTDAERKGLERDLHDGAQQRLVALSLSLRVAALRTADRDPDLEAALADVTAAVADLRGLARGIFPRELADEGLAAALQSFAESAPERVELRSLPETRFDPRVESATYFTVAYLTRSGRMPASVAVTRDADRVCIDVLAKDAPDDLTSLADRVRAVDGTITVGERSVRVELPCVS